MVRTIDALFDGDVLRPSEPLGLPPNTRVRLTLESLADAAMPGAANTPADFEREYQRLGRIKGPYAVREARESNDRFWVAAGAEGARWLIRRIRNESHVDILGAVADILADLGSDALPAILAGLAGDPSQDQACVLFRALGWMTADEKSPFSGAVDAAVSRGLADPNEEVREAAAIGSRFLTVERAKQLLLEASRGEASNELREVFVAELTSRE